MKRILSSLLMVTMLLSCSVCAFADGIDLSQMSIDELLVLRAEIETEINTRIRSESYEIFNGDYIVGEHIRSGRYVLHALELIKSNSGNVLPTEFNLENPTDSSLSYTGYFFNDGESCVLDLTEGMILHLYGLVSATLEPADLYAYSPAKG